MICMVESRHEMALRHVRRGREIVASQEQKVTNLRERGRDTSQAEDLLNVFTRSLNIFEKDLAEIEGKK